MSNLEGQRQDNVRITACCLDHRDVADEPPAARMEEELPLEHEEDVLVVVPLRDPLVRRLGGGVIFLSEGCLEPPKRIHTK